MEDRLTELEVKLAFAEDLLETLNHTVFRQQEEIERLRADLVGLARQVREWAPAERLDPREERPPHY